MELLCWPSGSYLIAGPAGSSIALLLPESAQVSTAVGVQGLAGVVHALPAVITLLPGRLKPLAVHAERGRTCETFACTHECWLQL